MKPSRLIPSLAAALLLALLPAGSQAQRFQEKGRLEAFADRSAYAPGSAARIAARITVEEGWHVNSNPASYEYLIPTRLELVVPEGWPEVEVTYPPGEMQSFAFSPDPLSVYDGTFHIVGNLMVPEDAESDVEVTARLTYQACDDHQCLPPVTTAAVVPLGLGPGGEPAYEEVFRVAAATGAGTTGGDLGGAGEEGPGATGGHRGAGAGESGGGEPAAGGARGLSAGKLAAILLLGLAGGLILNVMPCVLPVLSIKLLGVVEAAGGGRSRVVAGSLATSLGILVSFWALALAAVAAKAAGAAVGWGVQFQSPVFVCVLLVVVVLFSLNLWGLFEVNLPMALARVASHGPREGLAGHFGSGLFATLMATPCSAPFLGTAMGFALAQPAPVILAVFTAVGLGMALPYLALAAAPGAARLLPRPGAWMETVRGVMGFLLAGAAVWLLYVLAAQVNPVRVALVELAVLVLALTVWLRHRAARGTVARRLALAAAVAAVAGIVVLPFGAGGTGAGGGLGAASGLIPWVPFDEAEAEALAAEGRLVFVDVTAEWCLTCKVNERLVLETEEVAAAFERNGVVAMKGDWTNRNDEIGAYLASFDRYGIPFYALYRPRQEPHVFSELLTKGAVLEVVDAAGARVARAE